MRGKWGFYCDRGLNVYSIYEKTGYNKIEGKGYYSYFSDERAQYNKAYVILPTGVIEELDKELLLELCKDNKELVDEILARNLNKKNANEMFGILIKYNLTKK